MGFLGAIGKAVGHIPGMQTMNKALPGGGMPGVNQQPKPQLGGAMGPSIKPPMMPQAMNPVPQAPPPQGPPMQKQFNMPQFQPQPWMQNPNIPHNTGFAGGMGRMQGGGMGPSPMGMPQWMRSQNGGFAQNSFPRPIQTMMPQGQMMVGNPNRNMPQ